MSPITPSEPSSGDATPSTLPAPASQPKPSTGLSRRNFNRDIDLAYADIPICLCSFVSGLCDSVAFSAGSVFVAMQTGNTIFLALGTAALPRSAPYLWLRALVSIASFLAGALFFSRVTRRFRPRAKRTLASGFAFQAILIATAAALAQSRVARTFGDLGFAEYEAAASRMDFHVLGPIALLAFQFGGQIVTGRQLGFNEVPTNVLTSVYCDLMNDPALLAPWGVNPKRNRRAATVVLMLCGAISGGWLSRSEAGPGAALWVACFIKLAMAGAWMGWKTEGSRVGAEKR